MLHVDIILHKSKNKRVVDSRSVTHLRHVCNTYDTFKAYVTYLRHMLHIKGTLKTHVIHMAARVVLAAVALWFLCAPRSPGAVDTVTGQPGRTGQSIQGWWPGYRTSLWPASS